MLGQPPSRQTWCKRFGSFLCFIFAFGFALYSWGPLIDAQWGIIDDHEIMEFIGHADRLAIERIPSVVRSTELNPSSTRPRFRPAYFGLRIMEAAIWGKAPAAWYGVRIVIALMLAGTLTWIGLKLAGPILTPAFLALSLSAPYWTDIFARLGPSETYCVFGLCLMAWAWEYSSTAEWTSPRVLIASLGVAIAAGSKENLAFVGLLPVYLLFSKRVKTDFLGKLTLVAVLCFLAWIAANLLVRLHQTGSDVYSNDVSPVARLKLLISFLSLPTAAFWLVALLVLAMLMLVLRTLSARNMAVRKVVHSLSLGSYLLGGLALFAVYAFQFIIYNGNWPGPPTRYQFPGVLALHFAILLGAVVCVRLVEVISPGRWPTIAAQCAIAGYLVYGSMSSMNVNRSGSLAAVETTRNFTRDVTSLVDHLEEHASVPLIINYHRALDAEPIYSIQRFVRAAGLTNAVAIRPGEATIETDQRLNPLLQEQLATGLLDISKNGLPGIFVPLGVTDQRDCFSVGVSGSFLESCQAGGINVATP